MIKNHEKISQHANLQILQQIIHRAIDTLQPGSSVNQVHIKHVHTKYAKDIYKHTNEFILTLLLNQPVLSPWLPPCSITCEVMTILS